MEVGDENSPRVAGLPSVMGKAKPRESSGFPLAERSPDGQIIGPPPPLRQKGSGGGVADAEGGQHRRKRKSSRRLTADGSTLADLMINLESPETDENGNIPSSSNPKSTKKRHKRRKTAEFSAIDELLKDWSTAGDASPIVGSSPMDSSHETAGSSSEGDCLLDEEIDDVDSEGAAGEPCLEDSFGKFAEDDTADFSSLFPLPGMETPKAFSDEKRDDFGEKAAGPRPRVRHHSNQKPSQSDVDAQAHVSPCPPSVLSGRGGALSGADVGLVSVKPQAPVRRPKRSMSLDPYCGKRRYERGGDGAHDNEVSSAGEHSGDSLSSADGMDSFQVSRDGDGSSAFRSDAEEAEKDKGGNVTESENRKGSKRSDRRQTADFASLQELLSPLAPVHNRDTSSGFSVDVGVSSPAGAGAECEGAGDDSGGHTADLDALYAMMANQDANSSTASMEISPADSGAEAPVDVMGNGGKQIGGARASFSPGAGSNMTAQPDSMLRLLESTLSSGEEKTDMDKLVAESLSPEAQETLAAVGKGYGNAAAVGRVDPKMRRQTCERGEFEGIVDDLTSSDGRRFEESSLSSSEISIDARSEIESSDSLPSFSNGILSQSTLFHRRDYLKPFGKEKQKEAVEKKFGERRSTASPSALNSLMKGLGLNIQNITGESGKMPSPDPNVTAGTGELVRGSQASSCVVQETSNLPRGNVEDSSPKAKTPSSPKNPPSAQEVELSSPRAAPVSDERNSDAVFLAKRRQTCERGEFECIIDDLTTSDGRIFEESSSSSRSSIDARSVLECSSSSSSSMGTPSQSALFPPEENATRLGKERKKENGGKKPERRSTASPSALNSLMKDLISDVQASPGASGKDSGVTADVRESVSGKYTSCSAVQGTGNGPRGDVDNPPPKSKTPSPPVARRTRSKSPTSAQKGVVSTSPTMVPGKRNSRAVSPPPKPSNKNPLPPHHPESARAPLKSCFSSKKRARGPQSGTGMPNQGLLSMFGSPPAAGARYGSGTGEVKTPTGDMVMETPKRVMFGDPMAAEFNHLSPSNRLTPLPSRAAKSLFPVEKPEGDETEEDEDEETVANTAHLAEWDDMDAASEGLDFSSFDSLNDFMDAEEPSPLSQKSPRNRKRRDSLAPKSPVRRSIAAYSEDLGANSTATGTNRFAIERDSDSDVDSEVRAVENLNASISGRIAVGISAAAPATTADQDADARNLSFAITTSRIHDIPDSESSMELTGMFGSPIEKAPASPSSEAPAHAPGPLGDVDVETVDNGKGEAAARSGGVSCDSGDAAGSLGVMTGEGYKAGQDGDADDSRMDLNDSSELADPLRGLSLRDATSSPGTRRLSSGSLLDLVSEVGEIEKDVLSQNEDSNIQQEQGAGDEMETCDDSMELLSPLTDGAAAPRQSSADNESGDEGVGEGTGDAIARWSSVFTKPGGEKLATVHEEVSPGTTSRCPSSTLSLGTSMVAAEKDFVLESSSSSDVAQGSKQLRFVSDHRRESGESTTDLPSAMADFEQELDAAADAAAASRLSVPRGNGGKGVRKNMSSMGRDSVSGGEPTVDLPALGDFDAVSGGGDGGRRVRHVDPMSTGAAAASMRRSTSGKVGRKRDSVSGGEPTVDLPALGDFDVMAGEDDEMELNSPRRSSITDVEMEVVDMQDNDGDNGISSDPCNVGYVDTRAGEEGSGSRRRLSSVAGVAEGEPAPLRRCESVDDQGSAEDDVIHGKSTSDNVLMNRESSVADMMSSAAAALARAAPVAETTMASRARAAAVGAPVRPALDRRASSASAYVGNNGQSGVKQRRRASVQQPLMVAKDRRRLSVASDASTAGNNGKREASSAGSVSGPEMDTREDDNEEGNFYLYGGISSDKVASNELNKTSDSLSGEHSGGCQVDEACAASGSAAAVEMDSPTPEAVVDDADTHHHYAPQVSRRVSSALEVRSGGSGGESRRRITLQTLDGQRRRGSVSPTLATIDDVLGGHCGKGSSSSGEKHEGKSGGCRSDERENYQRQSSIGSIDLRKRLSSMSSVSGVGRRALSPPQEEELMENQAVGGRVHGSEAEESSLGVGLDVSGEEGLETEEISAPLMMNVEDLIRFVSTTDEGNCISSVSVSPGMGAARGFSFLSKDWRDVPDGLLHALASTLDSAATEMEDTIAVVREHAEASADAVWKAHTDAPILAEIDQAIAAGHDQETNVGVTNHVREMAKEIESGLQKQWRGWELHVFEKLNGEIERTVSRVSKTDSVLATATNQIDEMVSQTKQANQMVAREKSLADIRSRIADGKSMLEREQSDIASLEEELEALRREERDLASKKASLKEGEARRKERTNAAEKRRASVVKLMELENESIGLEKEAREWDDKFQAQLGLKLWCQPFKLFPHEVVVGYTMPHDSNVKHQISFDLNNYPMVKAKVVTFSDASVFKSTPAAVGNPGSASDSLSRIMFEGNFGLFGRGDGGSKPGVVISGLQGVKSVKGMKDQLRIVDWYVGRACSLLREVHELEGKYACMVVQDHGFSKSPFGEATLCVEVANWKTRTMLRLRFRVVTSFACCVGPPQVEVDVGAVKAAMVDEAISEAGGHEGGVWMVTKAVEAAASCIDG